MGNFESPSNNAVPSVHQAHLPLIFLLEQKSKLHSDIVAGNILVMEALVTLLYPFVNGTVLLRQESLRNKISRHVYYANVHNNIAKQADLSLQSGLYQLVSDIPVFS